MSSVPKVHLQYHEIVDPLSGSKEMDYTVDALLASEPHWRLANGSWSGGGPFYKIHQRRTTIGPQTFDWVVNGVPMNWAVLGYAGYSSNVIPSFSTIRGGFRSYSQQIAHSSNTTQFVKNWNRTVPGSPVASLGQFLLELRDLPQVPVYSLFKGVPFKQIPTYAKERLKWFSGLGSEYLNVEFGWKPFVKDLQQIYNLWKTIDTQMAQLIRDNGRGVKRRTRKESEVSTSITLGPGSASFMEASRGGDPSLAPAASGIYNYAFANIVGCPTTRLGSSTCSVSVKTTREQWYSAKYSYYIPDVSSSAWKARAVAALFGALPSPALVWEIMPWSWLVDWFWNVGDALEYHGSPGAVPNLVARYSYQMVTERTNTYATTQSSWGGVHTTGRFRTSVDGGSATCGTEFVKETKLRMGGTPFGLGSTYDSLSGKQHAILAALGMSRSNF